MAETIENNVRKLIIDEQPINPKYYEKMSELLDALIRQRKTGGDRLQGVPGEDRRADEAGEQAGEPRVVSGRHQYVRRSGRCMTTCAITRSWPSRVDTAIRNVEKADWRGHDSRSGRSDWPSSRRCGGDRGAWRTRFSRL